MINLLFLFLEFRCQTNWFDRRMKPLGKFFKRLFKRGILLLRHDNAYSKMRVNSLHRRYCITFPQVGALKTLDSAKNVNFG